jgi:15-cis-phytoene synthase
MRGPSRLDDAYAYCETLLRDGDKDRFLANLFLPAAARAHVNALHAFSFEVARVRELAREPMAGEIRHQWWRDALLGEGRGDVAANPVAAALLDTIARFDLPAAPLVSLIAARGFDLYNEPMPDLVALEAYCRETSGVLLELGARLLGAAHPHPTPARPDEQMAAAFHGGCAYAFAGLIRALPLHASRGQVYLPGDLLARHSASREDVVGAQCSPRLLAALGDWRNEALRHLAAASTCIAMLDEGLKPAFLPLALVQPYLRLTKKIGYEPFRSPIELPQWRRQWELWLAS